MRTKLSQLLVSILMILGVVSCKTPDNIVYLQDIETDQRLDVTAVQMIHIRAGDKLAIVVSSRNSELSNLFNLVVPQRYLGSNSLSDNASTSQASCFTVDADGYIDYPIFGPLEVAGLTRMEVARKIKNLIIRGDYIKDPTVTVEYADMSFSVLGEVKNAGRYEINKDRMTLLEALSMAGDLTINGERENVLVLREQPEGATYAYNVDLTSVDLMMSPAYYIQQNDMIYVTPNDPKRRESTAVGTLFQTPTFWMSLASLLVTIATFLVSFD